MEKKKYKKERKGKRGKKKTGLFLIAGIQISYPGIRGKIKVQVGFYKPRKKSAPSFKTLSSSGLFFHLFLMISWEVSILLSWG